MQMIAEISLAAKNIQLCNFLPSCEFIPFTFSIKWHLGFFFPLKLCDSAA
jgi:hypothetical protein